MYESITIAPDDPILSLIKIFQEDKRPEKVALSVGIYQDETGAIPKFDCIRHLLEKSDKLNKNNSYLPIDGSPIFCEGVQNLLFANAADSDFQQCIVTIQTLGASGALKIGSDFLKQLVPNAGVWLSDPSWDNHAAIFSGSGFPINFYPYYQATTGKINFDSLCKTFTELPQKSIVLLQVCCHNPTGVDLTKEQWKELIELIKKYRLIPFLDFAYQGFGAELEEDAWPIHQLLAKEIPFLLAQSFSKNMSMYGERVGTLSIYDPEKKHTLAIRSQLKALVRRNYSSPPRFGAELAAQILQNSSLFQQWRSELSNMRKRIIDMRKKLFLALQEKQDASQTNKSKEKNWHFLLEQKGMFSYTGLSIEQVKKLRNNHGVYLIETGRMCIAGINNANLDHVAHSLHNITNF